MKQKHWQVSVFDKTVETIKDDTFYATDTEVYLVFELIDEDFTPDSATVTVYNIYGKATIHESVEVADGIARYEIPAEAIRHAGEWRTQVIFTKDGVDDTTGVIEFEVGGHLLGTKKPSIVAIENWNSFMKHARELIDDWEQLEKIRQANEQQRELAELARQNEFEANEVERENTFEGNEVERQSTFEGNEVERQSEFEERSEQLEEEYAPKLTEVTAQLAQTSKQQQVTPYMETYDEYIWNDKTVRIHDGYDNFYATTSRTGATSTIIKSTDNGETWVEKGTINNSISMMYKIHHTGTLLAIESKGASSVSNNRIWRSTDDGDTWEIVDHTLNFPPISAQGITETPNGNILVSEYGVLDNHQFNIYLSVDDGITWRTVLSSPGNDLSGDPGHIHSVQYDPYADKVVAFMDRPHTTTKGARIYQSSDEGVNWEIVGIVDDVYKPNYVSLMFFSEYIAWGSDNERNGLISRIKREDFYAGNFDEVEEVIQLNEKAMYYTFPIREDMWLLSVASEVVGSGSVNQGVDGGTYSQEIVIVSENGSVVSGGAISHQKGSPLGAHDLEKNRFPAYKFDRLDNGGFSWVNIITKAIRTYSAVPYSVGKGLPSYKIDGYLATLPSLPNDYYLKSKSNDGNDDVSLIGLDTRDRAIFKNELAGINGATIRLSPDGTGRILKNNQIVATVDDYGVMLNKGLILAGNGVGIFATSTDPNGNIEAPQGSLCLSWNYQRGGGLWVKTDNSSNTGWIPINAMGGSTLERPTVRYVGTRFFDTNLGQPIWWSGSEWVDAMGNSV